MTTTQRIDLAIDALINDNSAEALGHLMLYKMEQIEAVKPKPQVRLEREPAFQDDLPPIKPVKNKEPQPIDFKCPTCGAKPGKPCVKVSTRGKEAKDGPRALGEPLKAGKRHAARRLLWNKSRGLA